MVQLISSNGKEIMVVPTFYNLLLTELKPEQIDDMLVYSLKPMVANKGTLQVKRLIDFVFSILIIIAASPIIIALFVLIPLTSRGPAIFKQERIGLHEKPYITYKFRSMVQDAEKLTGPVLASEHDPRITKLGRIMRALRLDELPQLFNVVKGDMSLVGPRPERDFL
ncbi:sugar transferase [Thalassobacillus sp. C254]|uniref:sugar transferase n=1 Tax=Thalassobacillus sp. C254 TaxID=1225341 RepID=UPI0006D17F62|nr:sugar transferase [Thalassobacillus sp. C254]